MILLSHLRHSRKEAMALRVASLTLLLVTTTISSGLAAEALPGESCAGIVAGTFRQSSGPEVPGAGHMLVCDGTNWQPVLSYNDDGEITTVGNQSCGNGDVLTYNSSIWTCGAGGGGSALFERSGTVVRPNSAAVTLSTDDFVFGSQSLDNVAGTDDDSRMYFDKSKGAFRVGSVTGTQWDASTANVGIYSMAWGAGSYGYGHAPTASGEYSTAWGSATTASGQASTAWGGASIASGQASTAWGGSDDWGGGSSAGGHASGIASTAWGSSVASGDWSTSWGSGDASGGSSTAWGYVTTASGSGSTAWGLFSHAGSYLETSLGRYPLNTAGNATSWVATDTLFEIGNGTADNARSNAVTVYKNGRTELNIANDAGSCTSAKTGRLRYDDANDKWEYCNGSDPWRPFEQAGSAGLSGPADCPEIGEACDDDTIFAGWHPITHERLFVPPVDQGQMAWRSSGSGNDTGAVDSADGRINQQWIEANRTIANYPAFNACAALNAADHLGHDDWYLPSRVETYYLWAIRTQLESKSETIFQNAYYWSSTEVNATNAWYQFFTSGSQSLNDKTYGPVRVRCVRR